MLIGPEISVLALADGYTIIPLSPGQDHKRIGEGDTGPNTGGMGVYAPAPVATKKVMDQIMNETLRPSIDGMRKEGSPLTLDFAIPDEHQLRFPVCWPPFHGFHSHIRWTQSVGIQRSFRRPGNRGPYAVAVSRH